MGFCEEGTFKKSSFLALLPQKLSNYIFTLNIKLFGDQRTFFSKKVLCKNTMKHDIIAKDLFLDGYNCAQSVYIAFSDVTGMTREASAAISSSFGGGIGRLREVCGAVSGMVMVAGVLYGGDCRDGKEKAAHYERVRDLVGRFKERNGHYICRELLSLPEGTAGGDPEKRTAEYYKKRPCAELVRMAAEILDEYIDENPPKVLATNASNIGEKE